MNIQGHMMSNRMLACNSTPEYSAWKNISMVLEQAESNPIYKMTGCLASCQRNEYTLTGSDFTKKKFLWNVGKTKLELPFKIMGSSYKEEEQYVIYDFNSFIGDVGGFLGLLLGYSALSIYDELDSLLRRFKCD